MNIISDREKNLEEELTKIQLSESNLRGKIKLASIAAIVFASILIAWMITSFQSDVAQAEKRCAKNVETITRQRGEPEASAQAASAVIQIKKEIEKEQHESAASAKQEKLLSPLLPLYAKNPVIPLEIDGLPASFAWFGNLPFGINERQFSDSFSNSNCTNYKGRICTIENLDTKCFSGINSNCKVLLVSFSPKDTLTKITAEYMSRSEFMSFIRMVITAFGQGIIQKIDYMPNGINPKNMIVKWNLEGIELTAQMIDGLNSDGVYKSNVFSIARKINETFPPTVKEKKQTRYTLPSDGSEVKDAKTGLIWQRCSVGQTWVGKCEGEPRSFTFHKAIKDFNNQSEWRLPSLDELSSLSDKTRAEPAIDIAVFASTASNWYLSSTKKDDTLAYYFSFIGGTDGNTAMDNSLHVRLVR